MSAIQKAGFDIEYHDLAALSYNSDSHGLPRLVSLGENATYAEQAHALLTDRYELRKRGIEPDGYIDELLLKIAKEGGLDLPKFVNENRPSVFDTAQQVRKTLPIEAEELQPPTKIFTSSIAQSREANAAAKQEGETIMDRAIANEIRESGPSNPYSAGRAGEANASGQVDKINLEASRNAPRVRRM